MLLEPFSPRVAADCTIGDKSGCTAPSFSKMEGVKSLMLQ
jgi:hypothetical protein